MLIGAEIVSDIPVTAVNGRTRTGVPLNERIFTWFANCFPGMRTRGMFVYDPANTGSTPNEQTIDNNTVVAFNASDARYNLAHLTNVVNTGLGLEGSLTTPTAIPGFYRYTSSATLSPVNRTLLQRIFNPSIIRALHLNFGGPSTGAGSVFTGIFTFPYLPNLDTFSIINATIQNSYTSITELRGHIPRRLKHFIFNTSSAGRLTAVQSRFPSTLETLLIAVNSSAVDVNFLIGQCVNLKSLNLHCASIVYTADNTNSWAQGFFGTTLNIDHITSLDYLGLVSPLQLTTINFGTTLDNLKGLNLVSCNVLTPATHKSIVEKALASSQLIQINARSSNLTHTLDITSIPSTLVRLYLYDNILTGTITLTTSRPNVLNFEIGVSSTVKTDPTKNIFTTVDVSGLTGVIDLDLSNSKIENLTLPTNTVIQNLNLGGNKLDIVVNPSLLTSILTYTSLIGLRLGAGNNLSTSVDSGQDSTNGFGSNLNISTLSSVQTFVAIACKLTGTLTVPSSLITLNINANTGLTAVTGGSTMTQFIARGCSGLNFDFDGTRKITNLDISQLTNTLINLSNKDVTTQYTTMTVQQCNSLTEIRFPATSANAVFGSNRSMSIINNSALTTLTNMSNISWVSHVLAQGFNANGNALNITFDFGLNNFIPSGISLQNNAMSSANVDATILNMYNNRTKWNVYGVIAKSINIAGTNGAAGGIYQAPAGFVLNVSDGTPVSAKERLFVLVNNYAWTATYN